MTKERSMGAKQPRMDAGASHRRKSNRLKEEDTMGAKGEAFAKQFEAKVEEATALLERLNDAEWKGTTAAENWTVAATAHHLASSYEPITRIITTIAAGRALPHFTRQMLDEMNAQ